MLLTSKANLRVCQLDVRQVPPASKAKGLMFLFRDATLKAKAGNALVDPDEVRIIPYYPLSIF